MRQYLIAIAFVMLLALLFPVRTRCGASSYACAIPPDDSGRVGYYYEVEPFGVMLLESMANNNFRIFYSSGTERVET